MKTVMANLALEERKSMREQIREQVRELIVSGQIAPGERLPSTDALAAMWGTHAPTVHHGLTALVREGLLERRHGRGTFVREREVGLQRVAIYMQGAGMVQADFPFRYVLFERVYRALSEAGIEVDVRMDPRGIGDEGVRWNELHRAARDRQFQAVIAPVAGRPTLKWLPNLHVPVAFFGTSRMPMQVEIDHDRFVRDSLAILAAQGCTRVGLIGATHRSLSTQAADESAYEQELATFVAWAAEFGMESRLDWLRMPRPPTRVGGLDQARYGRQHFHDIWSQTERPDGLIVAPDTIAQGVVLALAEARVEPGELRLVLQKNAGQDYLCPYDVTFAIVDEMRVATALLAQVERQYHGQSIEPQAVPVRFVTSTGRHVTIS